MNESKLQEMMDQAEPFVTYYANLSGNQNIEPDDFAQELRIALLDAAIRFDPSKSKWKTWAAFKIKKARVDILRKHGNVTRSGKRRCISAVAMSQTENEQDYPPNHAVDFGDPEDECDWSDLGEALEKEGREAYATYLYMSGITMKLVGKRLGVGESRVSQILGDPENWRPIVRLMGIQLDETAPVKAGQ